MIGFLKCILYLAMVGIGVFFIGRLIPKKLSYWRFPYKPFDFEKNGEIYCALDICKWRNKLPDMSKVFTRIMPAKKLPKKMTTQNMGRMVQETCIAELTHGLLCFMGLGCVFIWEGMGGRILFLLYLLGNIPFILIQRYNRPKLVRLLEKIRSRRSEYERNEQELIYEKGSDIKLQHGARA